MLLTTSQNPKFAYLRRVAVLPIVASAILVSSVQIIAQSKKSYTKDANAQFERTSTKLDTSIKAINIISTSSTDEKKSQKGAKAPDVTKALILVNDEKISPEKLATLNPADIQSMNVLKGEKALEKYGKAGEQGVIEIITKTNQKIELVAVQTLDVAASFPGGSEQLNASIAKHLNYPADAKAIKTEGKVFVALTIEASGKVSEIKVIRTPSPSLGEEATRVMKELGDWIPAKQNGQTVKSSVVLPIAFKL